ncbi:MAG: hypothetical protein ACPG47_01920 [Leucothrix sp.]
MKKLKKDFNAYRNRFFCFLLCFFASSSQAAIPSDFQNEKDLAEIVSYIKSHYEVLSDLRVIDLAELTVYYGDSCRLQFVRKVVKREAGWVGPAEPIEFKSKECMDDVVKTDQQDVPKDKVAHGVIVAVVKEEGAATCSLHIKDEAGKVHNELAIAQLCSDQTALDKPYEFIYEQTNVVDSCGDPDCADAESVWLIAEVK